MDNSVKPGIKTTEFWLSAISILAVAIIGILIGYDVINSEQGELWLQLIVAVAGIAVPVTIAVIAGQYSRGRSHVKGESAFMIVQNVNKEE